MYFAQIAKLSHIMLDLLASSFRTTWRKWDVSTVKTWLKSLRETLRMHFVTSLTVSNRLICSVRNLMHADTDARDLKEKGNASLVWTKIVSIKRTWLWVKMRMIFAQYATWLVWEINRVFSLDANIFSMLIAYYKRYRINGSEQESLLNFSFARLANNESKQTIIQK